MQEPNEMIQLACFYLKEANKLIHLKASKLSLIMPLLEYHATHNKAVRQLFSEICFSGVLPDYSKKWIPQMNHLAISRL